MTSNFWKEQDILLTGGAGFLGTHVHEALLDKGVPEEKIFIPRSKEHDLRERDVCREVVKGKSLVIHLAGNIGGIGYNKDHMAEMFYDNLIMGTELMEAARLEGIKKMVNVGTICSYPKNPPIPFNENDLWRGYPEPITGPYGLVKKMLLVQGTVYKTQYDFNSVFILPTNLYGPHDHSTHVIAMLIEKFVKAKKEGLPTVTVWGTGKATRDFLYARDAADGILQAAEKYDKTDPINLGSGVETSIRQIIEMIAELTEFEGEIVWDKTKPEGQPRRVLDITRAQENLGFNPTTPLEDGLKKTIDSYLAEQVEAGPQQQDQREESPSQSIPHNA
jgi:GDP-L-fucose synthase